MEFVAHWRLAIVNGAVIFGCPMVESGPSPGNESPPGSRSEVFRASLKLGLISFGGPVAHIGYFREEFVRKRRWLDDAAFGDLVALCQFLPGPASSQTIFALGMRRAGLMGGILASLGFTLPSAVLMILFAYGVASMGGLQNAGWLQGLKLAAVAVVGKAVIGMGRQLCPDLPRGVIALLAAACLIAFSGPWFQMSVILTGGVAGWWMGREEDPVLNVSVHGKWGSHVIAVASLGMFVLLLVLLPLLAPVTGNLSVAMFDGFYRAGSLVFGGGHVVLPLLRAEVVPNGWVGDDAFLAGYGAAQALPGPLFTFAAYLGAVARPGPLAWLGGLWCLIAIFLPSLLLISGVLPFWQNLRTKTWAQAAIRAANAAVVGVLLAAFYHPVCTGSIHNMMDAGCAIGLFALLQWAKCPPWLAVFIAAAVGQWLLV